MHCGQGCGSGAQRCSTSPQGCGEGDAQAREADTYRPDLMPEPARTTTAPCVLSAGYGAGKAGAWAESHWTAGRLDTPDRGTLAQSWDIPRTITFGTTTDDDHAIRAISA